MVTLEEYKKYLIEFYCYEYDNSDKKRLERTIILTEKYNDELMQKVIDDTYAFVKDILATDTAKDGYCSFELEDDNTAYISLGLIGGYYSDTLYQDINGRLISRYIIRRIFGKEIDIWVNEEATSFKTDLEGLYGIDYNYSLRVQGLPNNIDELRVELFGEARKLDNDKNGLKKDE